MLGTIRVWLTLWKLIAVFPSKLDLCAKVENCIKHSHCLSVKENQIVGSRYIYEIELDAVDPFFI